MLKTYSWHYKIVISSKKYVENYLFELLLKKKQIDKHFNIYVYIEKKNTNF